MKFLEQLLHYYQLTREDYEVLTKPVTFASLPSPFHFQGMEKVVERIQKAIDQKEKIVIYGDYDCDGVMATAILVHTFNLLNYPVGYYLPSRYLDGYGLNEKMVEAFHQKDYRLIITVDNGVSQHVAINKALDYGIETIVTDHHQLPETLPPAYAILHPTYSNYGETITCGAYVALMLSSALLGREIRYLVTLAALATMSDMMPLVSYNRDVVRLGVEYFNEDLYPALTLLAGDGPYTEEAFSLKIAPAINAVGRMVEDQSINRLIPYLLTDDEKERLRLYRDIKTTNQARKDTVKDAFTNLETIDEKEAAIVILTEEKEGLTGLLATQYLNTYQKPTIVFSKTSDEKILKGSARSKPGFHIVKAFSALEDLLLTYGGHAGAGGCSLKTENFPLFKARFLELASRYPLLDCDFKTIPINKEAVTWKNYEILRSLAPFGQGFPSPYFALESQRLNALTFSRDEKHILTPIKKDVKIVGFYFPKKDFEIQKSYTLIGKFSTSTFRNLLSLQFAIEEVHEE